MKEKLNETHEEIAQKKISFFVEAFIKVTGVLVASLLLVYFLVNYLKL